MGLLRWYRGTGADLPFGHPTRAHRGVSMEGYFWRITEPDTGRVIIALCGANRGPRGPWATIGLAGWPAGMVRTAALDGAWTDPRRLGVLGGTARVGAAPAGTAPAGTAPGDTAHTAAAAFEGNARRLRVDLAPDAQLDATFHQLTPWPRRTFGGSSVFHTVPGLNQYWHPWLLGGKASGSITLGGASWEFTDAQVYAEKNWGREGFPDSWWWGQAQGFAEPEACVAFAGGLVSAGRFPAGRLQTEVTALVVRLPSGRVVRLGNPVISPVRTNTSDEHWRLRGRGSGWRIEVDATAPLDQAFVLPVPLPSEHRNVPGDLEHLVGDLTVRVHRFGRHVWTGQTSLAALEHGGLERAQSELRHRGLDDSLPAAPPRHRPQLRGEFGAL